MKTFKISEMKRGWILGNFEPTTLKAEGIEMQYKNYKEGSCIQSYVHPNAEMFFVVLGGKAICNGQVAEEGEVVHISPNEPFSMWAYEDMKALYVIMGEPSYSREVDSAEKTENLNRTIETRYELDFNAQQNRSEIDPNDITVVVQGAVDPVLTPICLKSIRKYLPGSRIILSTWENSDCRGMDFDELIFNPDPGGVRNSKKFDFDDGWMNNINRQLVSTQEGLKRVHTKYAMKLRSDMNLISSAFLNSWEDFPESTQELRIFKHKVIISDLYSRHDIPCSEGFIIPTPFHPSDWFMFGLSEDLFAFYLDTPLMDEKEAGDYDDIAYPNIKQRGKITVNLRYFCEQYLALCALENAGFSIDMKDWTDVSEEVIRQSETFFMNNFIILDFDHHGIMLRKYFEKLILRNTGDKPYALGGLYEFKRYKLMYDLLYNKVGIYDKIWPEYDEKLAEFLSEK